MVLLFADEILTFFFRNLNEIGKQTTSDSVTNHGFLY